MRALFYRAEEDEEFDALTDLAKRNPTHLTDLSLVRTVAAAHEDKVSDRHGLLALADEHLRRKPFQMKLGSLNREKIGAKENQKLGPRSQGKGTKSSNLTL